MNSLTWLLLIPALAPAAVTVKVKPETIVFKDGDALITEYKYGGTVAVEKGEGTKPLAKPYFWPLNAPGGTAVTRDWPMKRGTAGETVDHFHQKSAWFCHGDVIPEGVELKTKNKHAVGVDFWTEEPGHGRIVCTHVDKPTDNGVVTHNEWRTADGVTILHETRVIKVTATGQGYLITNTISLQAVVPVTFGDTKEGSFGVRVRDDYRLAGGKGTVTSSDGSSVSGPKKGTLPMWGQVAAWHDYSGNDVGIAIFTDPKDKHASAWHTRDYGLMAANPFGRDKSGYPGVKGRTDLVKLAKGETLTLHFGLYVHTGDAVKGNVKAAYETYSK